MIHFIHHDLGGGQCESTRPMQFIPHLDDLDLGEVPRGLQVCGVSRLVKTVAHDANRLVFTPRPRAAQILETGDQLGNLLDPTASETM